MKAKDIFVKQLTTFTIAKDGDSIGMNFVSADGDHTCLSVPTECLTELIMTLPRMMRHALRTRHHDESLRLVYPTDNIAIEPSSDPKIIIVTLAAPDGFEVSFGLNRQQMRVFGAAADALERGEPGSQTRVFN